MAETLCRWCTKPYTPTSRGRTAPKGHQSCYMASIRVPRTPLADLTEPREGYATRGNAPRRERIEHPKGWEPRVEEDGDTAVAVSEVLTDANPDHGWLIAGWKLDPTQWRIVGTLGVNRWTTPVPIKEAGGCTCEPTNEAAHYESRWNYQYKARLERIDPVRESKLDSLIEEIRSHVPVPVPPPQSDDAFVVCIADSQMGKSDGDGAAGTAQRFLASIDGVETRISELRELGRPLGTLYLFGMGDLIESCDGHYPQQAFRVELNLRDQVNVMRRLILKAIERWAPLFSRVVVACVGGNHGEVRRDGKSFTDFADNFDVAIFDQLSDILRQNEAAYGHVSFQIPNDDLSLTFDVAGQIVGITHGHVAGKGGGGNVPKKLNDWWAKQAHGQQPIGDADILISAHYHHLAIQRTGAKTWIQCPAMEGGSDWFRNLSGQASTPGLLTLRVSEAGWSDLQVI
jgi:hypothetical protein